jgi:hypothetical protein
MVVTSTVLLASCASDGSAVQLYAPRLVGGGSLAGECDGYCQRELELSSDGRVVATFQGWGNEPHIVHRGTMTDSGLAKLQEVELSLQDAIVSERYGCPDCNDGGARFVDVLDSGGVFRSTYPGGHAPRLLMNADELLGDLLLALKTCSSSRWISVDAPCEPEPK